MKFKNTLILAAAAVLCFSTLTGCKGGDNQSTAESTQSKEKPASDAVIAAIDGDSVTAGEFGYYICNAATVRAYRIDQKPDLASFDWKQKTESGQPLQDAVMEDALNTVLTEQIMIQKAAEKGVTYTEDEENQNLKSIDDFVTKNGEESFLLNANALGISSVDDYKVLAKHVFAAQKAEDAITANFQDYTVSEDVLKAHKSDTKVTAKHILIKNDSEKFSDPKATIEEVLKRVKAGEDFDALMKEYNEDPGEDESGYTFGRGEMVEAFENAAFDLDCGEVSDVVETEYGYHIIKRVAGLAELQNYWLENASIERFDDVINKISVTDVMKGAAKAQSDLQAQNSKAANSNNAGGE